MATTGPGILIAIEGIDGAGKTTQASMLADALRSIRLEVVTTKEPTERTEWGRRIRASAASTRMPLHDELHAFVEDRRAHVHDLIGPGLQRGAVVIVDRYYFSTIAYQGARGANVDRIRVLNEAFAPVPDLLVILDVPASLGMARVRGRGEVSAFEREDELARAGAIFALLQGPDIVHLDGSRPQADLHAQIVKAALDGPVRARWCADAEGHVCDLATCDLASCRYVQARRSLVPPDTSTAAALLAIVSDAGLTDDERLRRISAFARAKESA